MGVRQIRYCDISGVENDVSSHELHIDQMRVELDLAGKEYEKLLVLLRPYLDAGRIEAALPEGSGSRASRAPKLSLQERQQVRQWAEQRGIEVPSNNRFKTALIEQWREETQAG
ncbi:hypothetical protein GCM10009836_12070 [Pseudonocardia ailaonensis]|uniref:Lsr2 protein n=1 Tax=Pseudonocardia ailaonensis TaxID=367279 RepID=A0ABN2MQN5_9PSEU